MKRKILSKKILSFGVAFFIVFLICSVSTVISMFQDSINIKQVETNYNTQTIFKDTEDINEKTSFELKKDESFYNQVIIDSTDTSNKDISSLNKYGNNTPEFYEYWKKYTYFTKLLGDRSFSEWYKEILLPMKESIIDDLNSGGPLCMLLPGFVVSIWLLYVFKDFIIGKVIEIFDLAYVLARDSIDMAFFLIDTEKYTPITDAIITAVPIDQDGLNSSYEPYEPFIASEVEDRPGWYLIPATHTVRNVDVPPGIYNVSVTHPDYENQNFHTGAIGIRGRYVCDMRLNSIY